MPATIPVTTADDTAVIDLGLGTWLVGHSLDLNGPPGLVFIPSSVASDPGTVANLDPGELPPGTILLRFNTPESILAHIDRIKILVDEIIG